jgi:hypothetical protein
MGKNDAAGRLNRPDIPIQTRAEAPKSSCYPARLHPGHAADFRKALAKADDPVRRAACINFDRHGILDAPLEPVIGRPSGRPGGGA